MLLNNDNVINNNIKTVQLNMKKKKRILTFFSLMVILLLSPSLLPILPLTHHLMQHMSRLYGDHHIA